MLTSIAVILLLGLFFSWIFSKWKLPGLVGTMIVGMVLSPYALDLIDESILMISGDLRKIALVIILTRAGLSLDVSDLKKVGSSGNRECDRGSLRGLFVSEVAETVLIKEFLNFLHVLFS